MPPVMMQKRLADREDREAGQVDTEVLEFGAAGEVRILRREDHERHDHGEQDPDLRRVDQQPPQARERRAGRDRRLSGLRRLSWSARCSCRHPINGRGGDDRLLGELRTIELCSDHPVAHDDYPVTDAQQLLQLR